MKVLFIAGFGPIATDIDDSRRLYGDALGITFKVEEGDYLHTEQVDGAKTFAVWPLAQAAESCFGTNQWPTDVAVPQAWLEFDVDGIEAATRELEEGVASKEPVFFRSGYGAFVRFDPDLHTGEESVPVPGPDDGVMVAARIVRGHTADVRLDRVRLNLRVIGAKPLDDLINGERRFEAGGRISHEVGHRTVINHARSLSEPH